MPTLGLPSVLDRSAWEAPAEPDDFAVVSAFILSVKEPDAPRARVQLIARLIQMRRYTRAELLLLAQEAPFRSMYGKHVNPEVLDEIVKDSRRHRTMLRRDVTAVEMTEICDASEGEIRPDQFGICGYGTGRDSNSPRFRYSPDNGPHRHAPTPLLPETAGEA